MGGLEEARIAESDDVRRGGLVLINAALDHIGPMAVPAPSHPDQDAVLAASSIQRDSDLTSRRPARSLLPS
jgi:hypothetical protein